MTFHYYPDTDSLYIEQLDTPSDDSEGVRPGIVLDFDGHGKLVGIDIDHASENVDLTRVDGRIRCDTLVT